MKRKMPSFRECMYVRIAIRGLTTKQVEVSQIQGKKEGIFELWVMILINSSRRDLFCPVEDYNGVNKCYDFPNLSSSFIKLSSVEKIRLFMLFRNSC